MNPAVLVVCPHCHRPNRLPPDKPAQRGKCGHCQQPLFDGKPVALSSADFSRHLQHSGIPILVDFWAPWCGPCQMMAPVFEQAARQLEPKIRLAKINTEQEPSLAQQFNIRSIPTLALFSNGKELARQAGAVDQPGLMRFVQPYLL